ncbi:VacJ family lipoprotein [Fontimonas sp. SYSU GA230001]|uniref:MlaA family lipoprotein n=1 Tax=Fontimonas sp. SYSU GA230001 TaxID=3142450 RepID=UPI0032B56EDB
MIVHRLSTVALLLALSACAHNSLYEPSDPLEPVNRSIYAFNTTADRYVLRPVAKGYVAVVPSPVRQGVTNFLDNLGYPSVILHDLLQLKFTQAARDTGRFLLNSTYGLAGFLDPASMVGLYKNDEDLGQTLGRWGVGEGWYLMLPLLGPTTNRDLVGWVGDWWTSPLQYTDSVTTEQRIALKGVRVIDIRSRLLDLDSVIEQQLDPYVFVRTAYLQRRLNQVYDGNPPADLTEPDLPED